ncbi:MAG: hypothetical protein K2K26_09030 [Muribaculaceae bacterium]|nr:hypothetical protein [Muribaculaceae bacterium]
MKHCKFISRFWLCASLTAAVLTGCGNNQPDEPDSSYSGCDGYVPARGWFDYNATYAHRDSVIPWRR